MAEFGSHRKCLEGTPQGEGLLLNPCESSNAFQKWQFTIYFTQWRDWCAFQVVRRELEAVSGLVLQRDQLHHRNSLKTIGEALVAVEHACREAEGVGMCNLFDFHLWYRHQLTSCLLSVLGRFGTGGCTYLNSSTTLTCRGKLCRTIYNLTSKDLKVPSRFVKKLFICFAGTQRGKTAWNVELLLLSECNLISSTWVSGVKRLLLMF